MEYTTKIVGENGITLAFKRWRYKRITTGVGNMRKLYTDPRWSGLYMQSLEYDCMRWNIRPEWVVVVDSITEKELACIPFIDWMNGANK